MINDINKVGPVYNEICQNPELASYFEKHGAPAIFELRSVEWQEVSGVCDTQAHSTL